MTDYKADQQRGSLLAAEGDYTQAVAAYTDAMKQLPSKHSTSAARLNLLHSRAECYLALGDLDAAEADCRAGLGIDATCSQLNYHLAQVLLRKQDVPNAAAAIAAAVAFTKIELLSAKPLRCDCSCTKKLLRLQQKQERQAMAYSYPQLQPAYATFQLMNATVLQLL